MFLQKKRKCPDEISEEDLKEKKENIEKEKSQINESISVKKDSLQNDKDISKEELLLNEEKSNQLILDKEKQTENELNISKNTFKSEKSSEKQRKQRSKKAEMTRDEIIIKEIRAIQKAKKTINDIFQKGFYNYTKKREYDFYLFVLIKYISYSLTDEFKDFKEDFTYYIYNNLRVLTLSKEFNETLKKIAYNPDNEKFFKEFLNFTNERWNKFISVAEKYDIGLKDEYKNYVKLKKEDRKNKLNKNINININNVNNNSNTENKINIANKDNSNNINSNNINSMDSTQNNSKLNNNNILPNPEKPNNNSNTENKINITNKDNINNISNIDNSPNNSKLNNNIILPNPEKPNNNLKENASKDNNKIPESNISINKEKENNQNNKEQEPEKFDINKAIEIYSDFSEGNQIELIVAGMVYNSLLRNEKDLPKEAKLNEKDKSSIAPTIPIKIEIQNFNLPEMPMVSIISGIKFYTNIVEINLSGNALSPKSCFWLGSTLKTNPNLATIDISRCNLDNDCLYMFVEGTNFTDDKLNKEQFNLERLNLKDNTHINGTTKNNFEHPLSLILEKFKLKWINLTNAKIAGEGTLKFVEKMGELLDKNKLFLENLVLICNEFKNEECLSKLGQIILKENCPLKNLILSKNLITTPTISNPPINHYKNFMENVGKSKIKELFLISCEIGSNKEDIDILYNMLKTNTSLISIRLFGNKINNMESFTKILGIFSEYNKPLENSTLKSLDLSKISCDIKVTTDFLNLIEKLKLEYLDINQNNMEKNDKETFRKKTNDLTHIKIIY